MAGAKEKESAAAASDVRRARPMITAKAFLIVSTAANTVMGALRRECGHGNYPPLSRFVLNGFLGAFGFFLSFFFIYLRAQWEFNSFV